MDKWMKYALITKICVEMEREEYDLRKITLHQLIYLLEELLSFPPVYEFKLYTYGPYSVELTSDLDELFNEDILKNEYLQKPSFTGYRILPGERYQEALARDETVTRYTDKIEEIIKIFGRYDVPELELKAAIIYLIKKDKIEESQLVERIQGIKPYFKESDIISGLADLKRQNLV